MSGGDHWGDSSDEVHSCVSSSGVGLVDSRECLSDCSSWGETPLTDVSDGPGAFSSDADSVFAADDEGDCGGAASDDDASDAASLDSFAVFSDGCSYSASSDAETDDMDGCGRDAASGDSASEGGGGSTGRSAAGAAVSGPASCDSGLCADSLLASSMAVPEGPASATCGVPRC